MPYYHQYLWYNLVMMATWGVQDIRLAMIDAVRQTDRSIQISEEFHLALCLEAFLICQLFNRGLCVLYNAH